MSKKYVPDGVYLACNKGTCPSKLRVSNDEKTSIYGSPMATEADMFPFFNLKPMGFCTDPSKILATGVMCVPTITEWKDPKEGISINGNRVLLEDSTCKCILGKGDISIHFDVASANAVALWGGAKMPTEYIKDGFDWAFTNLDENRAARDAMLPDWMQGVAHVNDWFEDLGIALVEGAVTGVVGLGEVIYQVAQDPVGMTEAIGGMISDADKWLLKKENQAIAWASDSENWSKAADDLWTNTTQTDWTQVISDGASATWKGTKDAASWVAKNPRKIGTSLGEFVPDAVAVVYTGGVALGATVVKKVGKEVVEEVVEKVAKETLEKAAKETTEEVVEAGGKKALKEGAEALVEKKADDIAKVVTKKKKLKANTPEHKAQRWKDYQKKKPDSKMTYDEWSNRYNANMKNPLKGNASADAYHKKIGWGKREVPMRNKEGEIVRKLDIADVKKKKAVEVKDYSSRNVSYDKEIKKELDFDKTLIEDNWDVEWVFKNKGPSKPLEKALKDPPPVKWKMI